jgi:hypothetical protein
MGETPDEIAREIEQARNRLTADLNQLEDRVKSALDWQMIRIYVSVCRETDALVFLAELKEQESNEGTSTATAAAMQIGADRSRNFGD